MDLGERLHFLSSRSYQFSQRLFFSPCLRISEVAPIKEMITVFCKFQDWRLTLNIRARFFCKCYGFNISNYWKCLEELQKPIVSVGLISNRNELRQIIGELDHMWSVSCSSSVFQSLFLYFPFHTLFL